MNWNEGTTSASAQMWSDTDFECPDCGGIMQRNNLIVKTSIPPKYEYRCKCCGSIRYRFE